MSSPRLEIRMDAIMVAYLEDLAKLGAYGKGRSGVARRFIENGIRDVLEKKVIPARSMDDFPAAESPEDE